MSKFYEFRQNNSGGHFTFDPKAGISVNVIIEATSPKHANQLAQSKGIYFNGVDDGSDCDCCGDRWSELWSDDEGSDVPSLYGKPVIEEQYGSYPLNHKWIKDGPETFVHYLDGTIQGFGGEASE